jgi:hypothetical protein
MLGEPAFQVGGGADVEVAVGAGEEDVDAVRQLAGTEPV